VPSRRVPQLSFSSRVTYCRSSGDFIGQDQVECGLNGRGKTSLLTYLLDLGAMPSAPTYGVG
jgi:hypothetical protein